MYSHGLKKLNIVLPLLILALFLAASFLGPSNVVGMEMNGHGQMNPCIFGGTGICSMTPLEHVATWEAMFTAAPVQASSVLLLLLVLFAVISAYVRTLRQEFNFNLDWLAIRQRLYARQYPALAYINPIQEALSQGILNPKTY